MSPLAIWGLKFLSDACDETTQNSIAKTLLAFEFLLILTHRVL
jgi:hypothetical protein